MLNRRKLEFFLEGVEGIIFIVFIIFLDIMWYKMKKLKDVNKEENVIDN